MLYVFLVDTGMMLTFDMNLAMETVSSLQETVSAVCHIPVDKQVLLISGGENLDPTARVCSYSAGTDTNPIFLFSKSTIEAASPPSPSVNYGSEADLKDQVEGCMTMPATYETVVTRAQLALQFHDIAKEELRVCERLVHDQHLQHQGWAAVVANLEDITSAFKNRSEIFQQNFTTYLKSREKHVEILASFPSILSLLSKVPLLPCLVPATSPSRPPAVAEGAEDTKDETASPQPATLLEWISAQDNRNSLEQMALQCQQGLQQFDESVRDSLLAEVASLLEAINNPSMKEVKGLEDRLYGLEQLMFGARRFLQEQSDMAQGFVQNQNRATNLRDPSVLPDLCNSHKRQLKVMLKNHQNLRDIRRRCTRAKEELSVNLHTRLRWVMYVEKTICDVDGKLVIYHENLKKLKRKLEITQQIHDAPDVYAKAVVEVVRRKEFTERFMKWAKNLAEESGNVHTAELERRHEFTQCLKRHFLQSLFTGFEDEPPTFAVQAPLPFDTALPNVTPADLETLRQEVPELASRLSVPGCSSTEVLEQLSSVTLRVPSQLAVEEESLAQLHVDVTKDQSTSDIIVLPSTPTPPTSPAKGDPTDGIASEKTASGQAKPEETPATDQEKVDERDYSPQCEERRESTGFVLSVVDDEDVSQSVEVLNAEEVEELRERKESVEEPEAFLSLAPDPPNVPAESENLESSGSKQVDVAQTKECRKESKTSPGISPDIEDVTGEEFSTADFYIDESMPSSMTDSPSVRKLTEMQQVVQEKTTSLDLAHKELGGCRQHLEEMKSQLEKAEENFRILQDLARKGTLQLKCDVLSIEKQLQKDKEDFQDYMDSVIQKVSGVIASFEAEKNQARDTAVENLRTQHQLEVKEYQLKLEVEMQKLSDMQTELDMYQKQLKDASENYDTLQREMDTKIAEVKQKCDTDTQEIRSKLTLEHEIELDKVRTDLAHELEIREQNLSELKDTLQSKDTMISDMINEKEKVTETLTLQFQEEKEMIVNMLEKEHREKLKKCEQDTKEVLDKEHKNIIDKLNAEFDRKIEESCQALRQKLDKLHEENVDKLKQELNSEHEKLLDEMKKQMVCEKENALADQHKNLTETHEKELSSLREMFDIEKMEMIPDTKTSVTQTSLSEGDFISAEKHGLILAELKQAFDEDKAIAVSQALEEVKTKHREEVDGLVEKMDRQKQESLQAMKASIIAEKQVVFNEAVSKLTMEKDKVIEDLKKKEAVLLAEQKAQKEMVERLASERSQRSEDKDQALLHASTREQEARSEQRKLEEELKTAREQIAHLLQQLSPLPALTQSTMGVSIVPASESSSVTAINPQDKISELELTLKSKEDELNKLNQKVMELSMSASSRSLVQDKVSITTCNVNDIVLLCLDERHDHYVVFTVGTTLHFLHSDCLEPLGLKTNFGEPRKSWVLAEIVDKEYCQARKPQNRFKVPVGTKFYRVKAKPWDREAALQREAALRELK